MSVPSKSCARGYLADILLAVVGMERYGRPSEALSTLRPWIAFAAGVLVVSVLYWARAVLVPFALAILFAFVLTPPVNWLQRWCGRVAAALIVVLLVVACVLTAGWGVSREMAAIANDLPGYRDNIRQKILDLRGAERNRTVEQIQRTLDDIKTQTSKSISGQGVLRTPVIIAPEQMAAWWGLPTWLSPLIETLETLGLATIMTVFVLIERQHLRARLIRLFGDRRLTLTTHALDEAAIRVSRQLLTQTVINVTYGAMTGVGLWAIGVPYPLLWAALAGLLRFVPYVGPVAGAAGPVLLSLAALPGWIRPIEVVALFIGLELFTNLVLEVALYADTAGVSPVALLVAIATWTWLWGTYGLLMATPLTICLVAFGRHVGGLEGLAMMMMADEPALAPAHAYYQRLLAGDQSEAWDLVEQHIAERSLESVHDALLLPALNYTRRDRLAGRLTSEEESAVLAATRELLADLRDVTHDVSFMKPTSSQDAAVVDRLPAARDARLPVLGCTANDDVDETALQMLQMLVEPLPIAIDIRSGRMLSAEIVALVQKHDLRAICIADLPPYPSSKTRYLVRKLRAAVPDMIIMVGRWAPSELADENGEALREIGATHVASELLETAAQLRSLTAHLESRDANHAA